MNAKLSKSLIAGVVACAAFTGSAIAADVESYSIQLKASIPSSDFHVRPVEAGWIDQVQTMEYDLATNKLRPIDKLFQYKNTGGAIQASLDPNFTDSTGSSILFSGNQTIALKVMFNNQEVTTTATDVVTAADANTGGRTNLKIESAENTALLPSSHAGEYTGTVAIIFEPKVTP